MIATRIKRFLQHRFRREFSFVQARLSPKGLFGLHLTIGTVVFVGAAWLFGGIAEDLITDDPLILVDELISEWFRFHAPPRFTVEMQFVSALASTATVSILFALMGCVFLWKRMAIYLMPRIASWPWRFLMATITILFVFLVALSRMYLGAHYLSDVLAVMAAGVAWVALCLTAVETLRRHRGRLLSGGRPAGPINESR